MLQAPSQLSRVCGHGHIKKFWLMQTQNESQACENASNSLSSASSRPVPFTSFKSSDGGKHAGAQWSRPLSSGPSAAAGGSAYGGSLNGSRHVSLLTCAESLTDQHALRPQLASSFLPEDIKSQLDRHGNEDIEFLPATSTAEDVDLLASSSHCDFDPAVCVKFNHASTPNYHSDSSTETDEDVSSACVGDGINPSAARHDERNGEQVAYKFGGAETLPRCGKAARKFTLSDRSFHDAEVLNKGFSCRSHERSAAELAVVRSLDMRTCSLCGTSKTPLWRSGPKGPKSLCNACGIRYKKSRRLASQVEGSESSHLAKPLGRPLKRKPHPLFTYRSSLKHSLSAKLAEAASQYQKKSKWPKLILQDHGEFHLDNIPAKVGQSKKLFSFSTKSGMKDSSRGIGKDEEEAAVLLMYLSCGLVCA